MPEGPELYMSGQFINQTCRNNLFSGQIVKSLVSRQPDIDWNEETYTISAVTRGKELKLTLQSIPNDQKENKKCAKKQNKTLDIVFQFGMSGKFDFYEANELQKHAHLNFFTKTENNKSVQMVLSFVDYRRFGKWQPNGNWSVERGPCVLTDYIPFRENILKNVELSVFRKPICEVLLNQKYFNGIGNYLRAEICYRAGIPPFQDARSVLEPLLTETNEVKIKSEKPDILQLCHLLPNEVINLGGTGYDPENRDPDYSKFTEWLQCYYKPGMKNMADHNKRTMWYDGNPGPLKPSVEKVRKIKRKKKASEEVEKTVLKKPKVEKIEDDSKAEITGKSKRTRKTASGPITRKNVTEEENLKKSKKKSSAKAKNADLEKSSLKAAGKRRATRRKQSKTSVSDTNISCTPKQKMAGNTVRRTRRGKRS
ncbi:endonuclease VIII-like 1 [Mytilus galloprovincialis]|uniref:Endonuclease VIII-like 1 n=1 Tax=Mytilus galloprovincialis TaxID=29158 RepID=A0A8B6CBR0_MYTGA|nr:endonuclease VIII-like 1 [Mytilus galloprovincialis]